jgi:hypothetical protein
MFVKKSLSMAGVCTISISALAVAVAVRTSAMPPEKPAASVAQQPASKARPANDWKWVRVGEKPKKLREMTAHARHIGFRTADELERGAELIVVGTPSEDFFGRRFLVKRYPDGHVMTFATAATIRVSRVIKSPPGFRLSPQRTLQVLEPVGLINEGPAAGWVKINMEDYKELKRGSRYLLFLKRNTFGQYGIINMNLGKFNLDGTDPEDLGGNNRRAADQKQRFKANAIRKYQALL